MPDTSGASPKTNNRVVVSPAPKAEPTPAPADEKPVGLFTRAIRGVRDAAVSATDDFSNRNDPNYWKKKTLENGSEITSTKRKKTEPWDPVKAWRKSGSFTQDLTSKTIFGKAALLLRRGGNMPDGGDIFLKASIKLYSGTPAAPGDYIAEFNYFVLTSIAMQDQERVDVVETFGAPHIFASGRFVRRYQFGGYMHTVQLRTPDRGNTRGPAEDYVPPIFAWKSFYEQYVRATQSAKNDVFVRVTTPAGDIFDGYIIATSDNRDSALEATTPFSFMMVVIKESDSWGSNKLYNGLIKPKLKQSSTVNKAELNAAVGAFEMKLKVGGGTEGSSATVDVGTIKSDLKADSAVGEVTLTCSHAGYILNVVSDSASAAFDLKYDDAATVNNTQSRSGASKLSIIPRDIEALRKAQQAQAPNGGKSATAIFVIQNGAGVEVTLKVSFTVSGAVLAEIISIGYEVTPNPGGTKALSSVPKAATGWLVNVTESEPWFVGTSINVLMSVKFALRGQKEPLKLDASKFASSDTIFCPFEGQNILAAASDSVDGINLKKCSVVTTLPATTPEEKEQGIVKVLSVVTVHANPADANRVPVQIFKQATGIGGRIRLKLKPDAGYEITDAEGLITLNVGMTPRPPGQGLMDSKQCTYSVGYDGFTLYMATKDAATSSDKIETYLDRSSLSFAGDAGTVSITVYKWDGNNADLNINGYNAHVVVKLYAHLGRATVTVSFSSTRSARDLQFSRALSKLLESVKSMTLSTSSGDKIEFRKE